MRAEGSFGAPGRSEAQEDHAGLTRTEHAAADQDATGRAAPGIARDCANITPRGAGYSLRHTGSI